MKEWKSKLQLTDPSARRLCPPSPNLIASLTALPNSEPEDLQPDGTPPMQDMTCAVAHAKWQDERCDWVKVCTWFCKKKM